MGRPSAMDVVWLVLAVTGLGWLVLLVWLMRQSRRRVEGPADGVLTDDGVRLYVEEEGDPDAPLTVVFVHGFTAQMAEFELQRQTLRGRSDVRIVAYDQRGHGKSGWGDVRHATMDQLGRDLAAVINQRVPRGPVVVFGHSMGGMTIMALAGQRPELFGTRIAGAYLLATSAGDLVVNGPVGLAVRIGKKVGLLPIYLWWVKLTSPLIDRLRKPGTKAGYVFYRRYLFGRDDATPDLVRLVQDLLEQTPFTIVAAFYPTFIEHDEVQSLAGLKGIPVTVLVGEFDRLTPARHSVRMAQEIGRNAELIIVPGAGHSVNITRQQVVDDALLRLVDRAASFAGQRAAG